MANAAPSRIYVLAGVNGSGKSSIAGATFRDNGADYHNPDEAARALRSRHPQLSQSEANAAASQRGFQQLCDAIQRHMDFAFESTLGASRIPKKLAEAAEPAQGKTPKPLLLHLERGQVIDSVDGVHAPQWARPILAAVYKLHRGV